MFSTFGNTDIAGIWTERACASRDDVFLIEDDGERDPQNLTYGESSARVDDLVEQLREKQVGPGDTVVVHMENSIDFVVAALAIWSTGAALVPTILQYTADELGYVLTHCEASAVLTDRARQHAALMAVDATGGDLPIRVGTEWVRGTGTPRSAGLTPETALLMYTSGTTSRPKGVLLSHAACLSAASGTAGHIRLRPVDRSYCVLPLFHVNALFFQLMPSVMTGSSLVLSPRFSASGYWDTVARHSVTVGNLTNGPLKILLQQPGGERQADSMRLMMYALPLTREDLLDAGARFGVELSMGWGLTESLACGTRTPMYLEPRHEWQSIGMVSEGWQLRVCDDDGNDVPSGEVGELLIRGPGLMTGYFKDPGATAEALVDGWLRTGDLGCIDAAGYVFFHDRAKDVLKIKGENVAAGEVERVVRDLPGIQDCALVGTPHPIAGERGVLFVVAADGPMEPPDPREVEAYCRERLASFKVPSVIRFLDDLPRTSIGKIRKAELRKIATDVEVN